MSSLGFLPQFSTPVEKAVENPGSRHETFDLRPVFAIFCVAKHRHSNKLAACRGPHPIVTAISAGGEAKVIV
jgi:hypothetical protein